MVSSSSSLSKPATKTKSPQNDPPSLSANFAKSSSIGYDHEIYLQLTAGTSPSSNTTAATEGTGKDRNNSPAKTANQVYREERTRHLTTRALDPAILEPRGDPSSVDFECAEIQRKKDRFQ